MPQLVSVRGVFPDQIAAGEALGLLESDGFGPGQIAIEKPLKLALAGFEWSQAIYVRLPEGIIAGFVLGAILSGVVSCLIARGIPPVFPLALAISTGSVLGTVIGAIVAMVIARFETRQSQGKADRISIGVLCSDARTENQVKVAFRKAGAAEIAIQ